MASALYILFCSLHAKGSVHSVGGEAMMTLSYL